MFRCVVLQACLQSTFGKRSEKNYSPTTLGTSFVTQIHPLHSCCNLDAGAPTSTIQIMSHAHAHLPVVLQPTSLTRWRIYVVLAMKRGKALVFNSSSTLNSDAAPLDASMGPVERQSWRTGTHARKLCTRASITVYPGPDGLGRDVDHCLWFQRFAMRTTRRMLKDLLV